MQGRGMSEWSSRSIVDEVESQEWHKRNQIESRLPSVRRKELALRPKYGKLEEQETGGEQASGRGRETRSRGGWRYEVAEMYRRMIHDEMERER